MHPGRALMLVLKQLQGSLKSITAVRPKLDETARAPVLVAGKANSLFFKNRQLSRTRDMRMEGRNTSIRGFNMTLGSLIVEKARLSSSLRAIMRLQTAHTAVLLFDHGLPASPWTMCVSTPVLAIANREACRCGGRTEGRIIAAMAMYNRRSYLDLGCDQEFRCVGPGSCAYARPSTTDLQDRGSTVYS
ncbi:hypothetical protein K431DRAFT_73471 [Polychaeton citri CBS 116435]|uniref:Uncharacterized protein n=1 Tax=Polychaeton citri CBS 116435 TaxID=1314669 RepID=A0A9P4Q8X2_9PEZI|nr:hypothetical protein K431DRAFT_73471 [Polychaeton citri CBS 116435]